MRTSCFLLLAVIALFSACAIKTPPPPVSYSPAATPSLSTPAVGRSYTRSRGTGPVYVRSYYRKDGSYVRSHYRSRPKRR
jgi:hypothetical protein